MGWLSHIRVSILRWELALVNSYSQDLSWSLGEARCYRCVEGANAGMRFGFMLQCSFHAVLRILGIYSSFPHVSFTKGVKDLHIPCFLEDRKSGSQYCISISFDKLTEGYI